MRTPRFTLRVATIILLGARPVIAQQKAPSADTVGAHWDYDSQLGRYRVEVVATGVRVPFGMTFLPDGRRAHHRSTRRVMEPRPTHRRDDSRRWRARRLRYRRWWAARHCGSPRLRAATAGSTSRSPKRPTPARQRSSSGRISATAASSSDNACSPRIPPFSGDYHFGSRLAFNRRIPVRHTRRTRDQRARTGAVDRPRQSRSARRRRTRT